MLEKDFLGALTIERHGTCKHFIQDDTERINIDLFSVFTFTDLRGHIVKRTHTFGLPSATRTADVLREPIVTDLRQATFYEDVCGFQVSVHDTLVVQVGNTGYHLRKDRYNPVGIPSFIGMYG